MSDKTPGITRNNRISDEGLSRLEKQLQHGAQISDTVLVQWIRRYGEPARTLIKQYERYHAGLEPATGRNDT